jgi:hypothetical protein
VCAPSFHAFVESIRGPFLYCSRCGVVSLIDAPAAPPRNDMPTSLPAAPPIAPLNPPIDEQAALDEVIYRLMRESDMDPEDPSARAAFLEESARADVTIDGRTFTPHGTVRNGPGRVAVDADEFSEKLPDPGL